jgi:hypothetical protein
MGSAGKIDVYLEIGTKRTFAGALDWPGWCRSGRDESAALQALFDYAPRYARVVQPAGLDFVAPEAVSTLTVVERVDGNPTTDFGAPDVPPSIDARPLDEAGLQRFQQLLQACWQAFDAAVHSAAGKELRKGPRGGGREVEKIVGHVREAEQAYLSSLGWRQNQDGGPVRAPEAAHLDPVRQAVLTALAAAAHGELPVQGPRGRVFWTPRRFTRRAAWHVLDHAWEIEDRII